MEQNNINVVYAADDNFIPVMGVSIVSLLKNNRDMSNINVTILATNVSELNKQKINDLFNKYDRYLPRWIDATNIEDTLGQKVNQDRGSVSQYARIFLNDIFGEEVDRVLYLDCDTLIVDSIRNLWNINLQGNTIAALKDSFSKYYRKNISLDQNDIMFNSGVMLIDMDKWRQNKVEEKVLNFIKEKNGNVQQGDQGVLNAILSKQTLPISPSYNFATVFTDLSYDQMVKYRKPVSFYSEDEIIEAQRDLHIIHYTSHFFSPRPWQEGCTNKYLNLWLDYRKMTPWGNEKLDTVNNSFKKKKILDMYKKMPKITLFLASIFQVYLRPIKNRFNN